MLSKVQERFDELRERLAHVERRDLVEGERLYADIVRASLARAERAVAEGDTAAAALNAIEATQRLAVLEHLPDQQRATELEVRNLRSAAGGSRNLLGEYLLWQFAADEVRTAHADWTVAAVYEEVGRRFPTKRGPRSYKTIEAGVAQARKVTSSSPC